MVRDLIQCFPYTKVILDPYSGSGTVALAAKTWGIDYIAIEKSKEYKDISDKRIASFQQELIYGRKNECSYCNVDLLDKESYKVCPKCNAMFSKLLINNIFLTKEII